MAGKEGGRAASRLAKKPDSKILENTLQMQSIQATFLKQRNYTQSRPSFKAGGIGRGGGEKGKGGGGG